MHPQLQEILSKAYDSLPMILGTAGTLGGSAIGIYILKNFRRFLSTFAVALTLCILGAAGTLTYLGSRAHLGAMWSNRGEDFILASFNSIDPIKASKHIDQTVDFMDQNGMTAGYTSVLYPSHDEDVAEFYGSLVAVQALHKDPKHGGYEGSTWWRQAMVERGLVNAPEGKKASVNAPAGISVHPNSGWSFLHGFVSMISLVAGGVWTGLAARVKFDAVATV